MPNELILTVGLPRSGKSTWAQETGHPVVNPDSIRLGLHGRAFAGQAEPFVWAIAKVMVRALFLAGHDTVVVDATNTTSERRAFWKSRDWQRRAVTFGGPEMEQECIIRAGQQYPNDEETRNGLIGAIKRMADAFEPVDASEFEDDQCPSESPASP